MTANGSPSEWAERYDDIRPTYQAFVERLETLLETLLDDEDIAYQFAYSWAERSNDFRERLHRAWRSGRTVDDPLSEWSDVAGVLVVVRTLDELEPILSLLEREFDVDQAASHPLSEWAEAENRELMAGTERLGYDSPYLVVKLSQRRSTLPEWRAYEGLGVKIDVRTILQDGWKDLDSDLLPYYRDSSYPEAVRRCIGDAARHFIEADHALAEIWPALWRADEAYDEALKANVLSVGLDARSLESYLRVSETVDELVRVAEGAGLRPGDSEPSDWEIEQLLLWLLATNGIATLAELDEFTRTAIPRAPGILADIARLAGDGGFTPYAYPASILAWLLLVLNRADGGTVALADFREEIEDALNMLIGNPPRRAEPD
jgi:ppGpp synthetase/RelA/SpoT-type nucleotidyltranferase